MGHGVLGRDRLPVAGEATLAMGSQPLTSRPQAAYLSQELLLPVGVEDKLIRCLRSWEEATIQGDVALWPAAITKTTKFSLESNEYLTRAHSSHVPASNPGN